MKANILFRAPFIRSHLRRLELLRWIKKLTDMWQYSPRSTYVANVFAVALNAQRINLLVFSTASRKRSCCYHCCHPNNRRCPSFELLYTVTHSDIAVCSHHYLETRAQQPNRYTLLSQHSTLFSRPSTFLRLRDSLFLRPRPSRVESIAQHCMALEKLTSESPMPCEILEINTSLRRRYWAQRDHLVR